MAAKPCGCAADPEQTSSPSFPSPREGLQCPELALLPGHSLSLSACTLWMLLWLSFCAGIEGALVPSVTLLEQCHVSQSWGRGWALYRVSNNQCSSPKRGGRRSRGEDVTSADAREGEGEDVHCKKPKLAQKRKC